MIFATDNRKIYVAGPLMTTKALSRVLEVLQNIPVIWVASHDPADIFTHMLQGLPSQFCRGEAPCVLDLSHEQSDSVAMCVQTINHLRNHPLLEWEGGLWVLLPDEQAVKSVGMADLFGGQGEDKIMVDSFKAAHRMVVGVDSVSAVVSGLSELKPLRYSAWQKALGRGHTKLIVDELKRVRGCFDSEPSADNPCFSNLVQLVHDCDWDAILPMHDCGIAAKEALKRVRSQACDKPLSVHGFVQDVTLLLQLAGVCHE